MLVNFSLKMIKIPRTIVYFPFSSFKVAIKIIFYGHMLRGKYVERFEYAFRKYIGTKYAISVSCGKAGLYFCLKALDAKKGDEIILPSYTVWDVPAVIVALGMKPVFVDINSTDFNLNVQLVKKSITEKTKFILATHLYGYPCDMDVIQKIAEEFNLKVIEDCAQSLGAEYKNKKTGNVAEMGYFSFGILKNFNTLGGGMVVTNNISLANKIRKELKDFSYPGKRRLMKTFLLSSCLAMFTSPGFFSVFVYPIICMVGNRINQIVATFLNDSPPPEITGDYISKYKFKFTNLQAGIGLDQLKRLDVLNERRIENATILTKHLKEAAEYIRIHCPLVDTKPIYLNYVIQVPENQRELIMQKVREKGVDIGYGFLHSCASMKEFREFKQYCPISDSIIRTNLYIPIQPPLESKHMEYIAKSIVAVVN